MKKNKKFTVLSIEDNKPDFSLIEKALTNIPDLELNIINITDGQKALNFILKKERFKNASTPHLIILDINLPTIKGQEILRIIKNHKTYKTIPIIIFSSSDNKKDIKESYELSANSYIIKSFEVREILKKIKEIGMYWLKTVEITEINDINDIKE